MDYTTNLNRFIEAQNSPGFAGYNNALEEIRRGKKLSHWIWYVFPQLKSLSQNSPYDKKFGIDNLEEAKAYLNNSTLRKRLDDVCETLLKHEGKTASGIFGVTDSSRVRSSMTLFYLASNNELYKQVLEKYYNGRPCQNTLYALNMRMPESPTFSQKDNNRKKENFKNSKQQTYSARPLQFVSSSRQRVLRRRKMKKLAILVVGFIGIIAIFGGMGYGVYSLFSSKEERPIIAETDPEITDSPNIDLHVNVSVMTSDKEAITFSDKDKYAMSLMASIGNNPIQLDSSTSKFSFLYNNENCSDEIKIDAKVETCQIGGQTYSMSNYDIKEGSYDEIFNLDVSKEDLRIYEELTWYQSANHTMSSAKYAKYVDRIKKVQNPEFAELLAQKLSSVGNDPVNQKKAEDKNTETQKKELGKIPEDIRDRLRRAAKIPISKTDKLTQQEQSVIISYNTWLDKVFRRKVKEHQTIILNQLGECRTYVGLKSIINTYRADKDL